jgi:DNA-directed RNA polymerase specialized sigma54-like protein
MTKEKELTQYDEDDAVKYIRNYLPQEVKDKYSDDEINYIIDIIYDFYEEKGYMDEDSDEDITVNIDEDELIAYVLKNTRKDKINDFSADDISFIIQGELAYCESIGVFE